MVEFATSIYKINREEINNQKKGKENKNQYNKYFRFDYTFQKEEIGLYHTTQLSCLDRLTLQLLYSTCTIVPLWLNGIEIGQLGRRDLSANSKNLTTFGPDSFSRHYNAHWRRARLICLIQREEHHFGGAPISPGFNRTTGRPGSLVTEYHRKCVEWSHDVRNGRQLSDDCSYTS